MNKEIAIQMCYEHIPGIDYSNPLDSEKIFEFFYSDQSTFGELIDIKTIGDYLGYIPKNDNYDPLYNVLRRMVDRDELAEDCGQFYAFI